MKTDDRASRQRNEADGDEAKVVRLSDWLAPDDELVPFGPRAHAQTAARAPAERDADPDSAAGAPAAAGFWDGDTSAHTAVPGPGLFDDPGERIATRRRYRPIGPVRRPALPPRDPFDRASRAGERLTDLVGRISWRWTAAAVAFIALALVVLVFTFGGSSSEHHELASQASLGNPSRAELSITLGTIGTATSTSAVADLQRLPPVDAAAVLTIGVARKRDQALRARHRRPAGRAPAPIASSPTAGSVEAPTTTPAPTETVPAPTETEPVQTTSTPAPTTGGGGSSSGSGSTSGSEKQPAFGATGSLGPGSSPNG